MSRNLYPILLASFLASPALAQSELPYVDNRTDATSLISSFYNAISRKEYGRAWSYYGDQKPSATFDAFQKGYEGTKQVAVRTGAISQEGAAVSTYFQVPVAILTYHDNGDESVFAGCYTLRLANPQIQGENFNPLHIEKASLKLSTEDVDAAVPRKCGEGQATEAPDPAMEAAQRLFAANDAGRCGTANPMTNLPPYPIDRYEIAYRSEYDAPTDPERKAVLMRFYCRSGAYNEMHLYYIFQGYSEDDRELTQVALAAPQVDPKYVGDDDTKVESLPITGYAARIELVNSSYDPKTKSITEHSLWRGMGDASSTGTWVFRDGNFVLERFEVDASYDGEINPRVVYQARK